MSSRSRRPLYLCAVLLLALAGSAGADRPRMEIATWNLEWFDSGPRGGEEQLGPRAWPQAYQTLAQIIRGEGPAAGLPDLEVIGLQEVTDPSYVTALLTLLPGWQAEVLPDRKSYQRCALLWDANEVRQQALPPLPLGDRQRQAVHARLAGGAFDFDYVVCHLKSGNSREDRDTRGMQTAILSRWLHNQNNESPLTDTDVLLGGDLNAEADEPQLMVLLRDPWLTWCFASWQQLIPTRPVSGRTIDHLFFTPSFRENVAAVNVWERVYEQLGQEEYRRQVSDHLPVVVSVYTDTDAGE